MLFVESNKKSARISITNCAACLCPPFLWGCIFLQHINQDLSDYMASHYMASHCMASHYMASHPRRLILIYKTFWLDIRGKNNNVKGYGWLCVSFCTDYVNCCKHHHTECNSVMHGNVCHSYMRSAPALSEECQFGKADFPCLRFTALLTTTDSIRLEFKQ